MPQTSHTPSKKSYLAAELAIAPWRDLDGRMPLASPCSLDSVDRFPGRWQRRRRMGGHLGTRRSRDLDSSNGRHPCHLGGCNRCQVVFTKVLIQSCIGIGTRGDGSQPPACSSPPPCRPGAPARTAPPCTHPSYLPSSCLQLDGRRRVVRFCSATPERSHPPSRYIFAPPFTDPALQ